MRYLSRFGLIAVGFCVLGATPVRAADIEKLLPNSSEMVLSFNIQQVTGSEIYKKFAKGFLEQQIKNNDEAQKFIEATGLNPLEDLTRVTFASEFDPTNQTPEFLGVIEGKWDKTRLVTAMNNYARQEEKVTTTKEGDHVLYKFEEGEGQSGYGVFVDNSLAFVGNSRSMVMEALDRAGGQSTNKLKPAFVDAWKQVDSKKSLVVAMVTKGKLDQLPVPNPQAADLMEKLEAMTISLDVSDELALEIGFGLASKDEAKQMAAMMQQAIPQAKQMATIVTIQQPDLKEPLTDLANSLQADSNNKFVTMKAKLSSKSIEALVDFAKKQQSLNSID